MTIDTEKQKLKFMSLNIQGDEHLEPVRDLLLARKPDILCLQEVHKPFAEEVARMLGYEYRFCFRTHHTPAQRSDVQIEEGTMIAWHSSFSLADSSIHVYNKRNGQHPEEDPNDVKRSIMVVSLESNGEVYRIGTTHFTWTPDGGASQEQREDMQRMLGVLETYHDNVGIIFCGDFNAPRGGEIFKMMSDIYTDNLPSEIATTLDQHLHRAAPKLLVVDTIFSTKEYNVDGVEVVGDVSDHMALFANVSKSVC